MMPGELLETCLLRFLRVGLSALYYLTVSLSLFRHLSFLSASCLISVSQIKPSYSTHSLTRSLSFCPIKPSFFLSNQTIFLSTYTLNKARDFDADKALLMFNSTLDWRMLFGLPGEWSWSSLSSSPWYLHSHWHW